MDAAPDADPPASGSPRRVLLRRLVSLSDQVLSGASNFLTVALVARSTSPDGFGQFVLAYALVLALLIVVRGVWGTPISLAGSARGSLDAGQRSLSAALVASPIMVSLIAGPTLLLTGGSNWQVAILVSLAAPIVCAQDLLRFASISADRPGVAAFSDGTWLVAVALGYILQPGAYWALAMWAGGASIALVVAIMLLRIRPSLRLGVRALQSWHPTGVGAAVFSFLMALATYVVLALATVAVGASTAAALRGASSMMAPVNTLLGFMSLSLLPMVHRLPSHRQPGMIARIAGLLVLLTAAWSAVLLVMPPWFGALLLGDTWPLARNIMPWTSLEYLLLVLGITALLGLQARQVGRSLLVKMGIWGAALLVSGGLVGATVADDATPFAIAQAASIGLGTLAVWVVYLRTAPRCRARDPELG